MPRRVIILGGPRVGKSTLSGRLQNELGISTIHTSQELEKLFPANQSTGDNWSKSSDFASQWFDADGDWICEGVQMARALRKWLRANPGKPLDADVFLLRQPFVPLLPGQDRMRKGILTVFHEIEPELIRRGARIQKLKDPNNAIEMLLARDAQSLDTEENRMPLKVKLTKAEWESLSDDVRKLYLDNKIYLPDGENFKLDAEGDVEGGLKTALERERQAAANFKKQFSDLSAKFADLDPEKAREALAKLEELETKQHEKDGNVQAIVDSLNQKFSVKEKAYNDTIAAKEKEITSLKGAIEETVVDQALLMAITKHNGNPKVLLPIIKNLREAKAVQENGTYAVRFFKGGDPDTLMYGDTKLTPMNPEQYVEAMKQDPDYSLGFYADGRGGTGALPGGGGGGGGATKVIRLDREEVKRNNAIYAKAKEEAAKVPGTVIEFTDSAPA